MTVCVELDWSRIGALRLRMGALKFPKPPDAPGIYRFDAPSTEGDLISYIGQTDSLPRRFGNYRSPGPTQVTNIRINRLLTQILQLDGGEVDVLVAVGGRLNVSGTESAIDMSLKAHRLLAEGAAVVEAGHLGVVLANR